VIRGEKKGLVQEGLVLFKRNKKKEGGRGEAPRFSFSLVRGGKVFNRKEAARF